MLDPTPVGMDVRRLNNIYIAGFCLLDGHIIQKPVDRRRERKKMAPHAYQK